jgi:hypothetical protein
VIPPKAAYDAPEWRAAIEALMLVAEHGGPTMVARIGVMRSVPVRPTELAPDLTNQAPALIALDVRLVASDAVDCTHKKAPVRSGALSCG